MRLFTHKKGSRIEMLKVTPELLMSPRYLKHLKIGPPYQRHFKRLKELLKMSQIDINRHMCLNWNFKSISNKEISRFFFSVTDWMTHELVSWRTYSLLIGCENWVMRSELLTFSNHISSINHYSLCMQVKGRKFSRETDSLDVSISLPSNDCYLRNM
jgi:hypothetical protein